MNLQKSTRPPNWRQQNVAAIPVHTHPAKTPNFSAALKRSPLRKQSPEQRAKLATWADIKAEKMRDTGGCCEKCGAPDTDFSPLEAHHVIGRGVGGADTYENCLLLCFDCHHIHTHGQPEQSYADGSMIRGNVTPAAASDFVERPRVLADAMRGEAGR